jgi:hypothetical protein
LIINSMNLGRLRHGLILLNFNVGYHINMY